MTDALPGVAGRSAVLRQAASVSLATGAYGISFGALAVTSGLNLWQTCVLSLLLFSGGSQFALIGVIGAGGAGISAAATAVLLGSRNTFYGLQLTRLLRLPAWLKPAAAQLTIDESTAVALGQPNRQLARVGFWATGIGVFVLWNLTTLAGALAGDALGDPRRYGLDAAAPAAFMALMWPRLRARQPLAVGISAAVVALLLSPVLPAGIPVLIAALAAVVAGALPRRGPPPAGATGAGTQ